MTVRLNWERKKGALRSGSVALEEKRKLEGKKGAAGNKKLLAPASHLWSAQSERTDQKRGPRKTEKTAFIDAF